MTRCVQIFDWYCISNQIMKDEHCHFLFCKVIVEEVKLFLSINNEYYVSGKTQIQTVLK
jgi:hypothetical protein